MTVILHGEYKTCTVHRIPKNHQQGYCNTLVYLDILIQETSLMIDQHFFWVMASCRQAASHYQHQCWARSMPPNGITRLQCIILGMYCLLLSNTSRCYLPPNLDWWLRWEWKTFMYVSFHHWNPKLWCMFKICPSGNTQNWGSLLYLSISSQNLFGVFSNITSSVCTICFLRIIIIYLKWVNRKHLIVNPLISGHTVID